jgi:hypothetical protein
MAKAFVETTVLTDALLKPEAGKAARAALRKYEVTELPAYAIKEFKAGPLKNVVWFHNKLVTTSSFARAIGALQKMSLSPKRYTTATALEALREAARKTGSMTTSDMVRDYGPVASQDAVLTDRFRLAIKTTVSRAWRRRKSLVSAVVYPLPCYQEVDLTEESGQLILGNLRCNGPAECEMAQQLKKDQGSLVAMKAAVDAQPPNAENHRRSQALRHLIRTPKREFPDKMCRALGDAVFAFLAPSDSTILTTNVRDIEPLAKALGKPVERP